jgi:hypothetical protein
MAIRRRGRPLKFGRQGQSVTLTLPADVVDWLHTLHDDLGWAIVGLHERRATFKRAAIPQPNVAELVQLPGRRALILVRPELLRAVRGVAVVPLSDGRAFIALDAGSSVADLELAVIDRIETPGLAATERAQLGEFRQVMRQWRTQGLKFQTRAILVVERQAVEHAARPLSALAEAR